MIQELMIKLVENEFFLLKRFVGETDDDLFAYLAAICRSVVVDWFRAQTAAKRLGRKRERMLAELPGMPPVARPRLWRVKKLILARELCEFVEEALRQGRRATAARNRLIFHLYYVECLSTAEIARCRGIELTKEGVKKVLNGIKRHVRLLAERDSHQCPSVRLPLVRHVSI